MARLLLLFCVLVSFTACHPTTKPQQPATAENNLITSTHVGPIQKGMTIKELRNSLPDDKIKKLKSRADQSGITSDDYYIYNDSSQLQFIVSPEQQNNENSKINRTFFNFESLTLYYFM